MWRTVLGIGLAVVAAQPGAMGGGILGVGTTRQFGKAEQSGARVEFAVWQWGERDADRKQVLVLKDGMRIPWQALPQTGMHLKFRIPVVHDTVRCLVQSTDGFDRSVWGPDKVPVEGSAQHVYRAYPEDLHYPPQVGRYLFSVQAWRDGKSVALSTITFDVIDAAKAPEGTHYLQGKKDCKGNPITGSTPVVLNRLNETPVLKDNDYPFEPQHAYNVINFERFPPFSLPRRFIAIWNSRRFTDESFFGGPLNRGFTALEVIHREQDNLPISQRAWFHTPDLQVAIIKDWVAKDPAKYADLKAYADYRSAFVSAENAYKLGWACYESWGAGGYQPYDAGLYGWDEEQMWPTIAIDMLKQHPEALPEKLRALRDTDPQAEKPETQALLQDEYSKAWGDFVGNGYRGARDAAKSHGRVFKIWHYGSKAPGEQLFVGPNGGEINQDTGKYRAEEMDGLWSWFKRGDQIDYTASVYSREIDYFHKDFYYHTLAPQKASMYEKDADGRYVLDDKGRRRVRKDLIEEANYVEPVKVGFEDYETGPAFLKAFISKGENALFWMNGGKAYTKHGTLITDKQLIPALRPGNQETWGESAKLGSRPVCPYLAEAASIYTFMMGLEGLYFWDARLFTGPAGYGDKGDANRTDTLGDIELVVKGMHRVSQLNPLFEGTYYYVRPIRYYDVWNRDHPVIRGILNGRYLALAMTNAYLDPGETQQVEVWYGGPYKGAKTPVWSGTVTLQARRNHLFQCKLPALPAGQSYSPDRLYFRYTCADGTYRKTYTLTGNYDVAYPYGEK